MNSFHPPHPPVHHPATILQTPAQSSKQKLTMGSLVSKATSKRSSSTPEKAMAPATFTHYPSAQTTFQPPLIANENAYLGDIATSEPLDPTAPISAGFYRLEKGTPLVYEYTYHEMKIIVDGEFEISDEKGKKVHAKKGDVFYFEKGSKITFTTETFGLGFYVGQRKVGIPYFGKGKGMLTRIQKDTA
jgi:uncharacterized cupin superfamily protein